jgi:hypothetical protein
MISSVWNRGLREYVALGIKVEGTDNWLQLFGSREDYDLDAGVIVLDYGGSKKY